MPETYDLVFLDENGAVMVATTLEDPNYRGSRNYILKHEPAHIAMLLPTGEYDVSVGDQIPFDPVFLGDL